MYNPSDLNTKKLSRARRELLMSIIGITDDREVLKFMSPVPKISGSVMRTLMSLVSLAGLPLTDATSMEQVAYNSWTWVLLATAGFLMMMLVWMVPGSRSRSPSQSPRETASERRRRYQNSDLSEVSDPETWMLHNHHSDMEEDEPEREPPRIDMAQRVQTGFWGYTPEGRYPNLNFQGWCVKKSLIQTTKWARSK